MEKLMVEEIRLTNIHREVERDIVMDPTTKFFNKQKSDRPLVATENGFHSDVKQSYNGNNYKDIALYAYSSQHYDFWQEDYQTEDIPKGIIGENLIVQYADEFTVFIGDVYQCGEAKLEVSQPHLPHWGVSVRMKTADFAMRMHNLGRTGWYFRVIEPGEINAGDELVLLKRPYPDWSIAACHEVLHFDYENLNRLFELSKCNALGSYWKEILKGKLRGKEIIEQDRLLFPKKKVGVV